MSKTSKPSPAPSRKQPSLEPQHVHREPNDGGIDKVHAPFIPKRPHGQ